MRLAIDELQECITQTTGAKLPIVYGEIKTPGIVIGDCPRAAQLGLVGSAMPVEGFAIKNCAGVGFHRRSRSTGRHRLAFQRHCLGHL